MSKTITGEPVKIIAYQLIIEKDVDPHPHAIGKRAEHVPSADGDEHRRAGRVPRARTAYNWEVLAIERSGNQTLSSGSFQTR